MKATTSKKPAAKKTQRNALGRSTKEQEAFDQLTQTLEGILNGDIKASGKGYISKPINIGTEKGVTGSNAITAIVTSIDKGDCRFIGAKEAITLGYNIKGAKANFFTRHVTKKANSEDENDSVFFKSYPLLNLADIEHDLDDHKDEGKHTDELVVCDELLNTISEVTTLTRNAETAHLIPTTGKINIPPRSQFFSNRMYASTIAHELAHFVARDSKTVIEYKKYRGYEELCAEVSAFIYCFKQGLVFEAKNAAYIASWIGQAKTTHTDPMKDAMAEAAKRVAKIEELVSKTKKMRKAA